MKPFVKWVGGKRQLSEKICSKVREKLSPGSTYYEPLLGGGAILLELRPDSWHAGDSNPFLVNLWNTIKDHREEILENIGAMAAAYDALDSPEGRTQFYLERRMEFNIHCIGEVYDSALFVFLNHTCFNGLWRVNRNNEFNVPHNKALRYPPIDQANFEAVSAFLHTSDGIRLGGYLETLSDCKEGDVVYFDPPYVPLTETSSFTAYTKEGFGISDQKALRDTFRTLSEKGVWVIMSNSNSSIVHDLYSEFHVVEVEASRSINSDASKRQSSKCETIITNW